MSQDHHEIKLEDAVIRNLVKVGWVEGSASGYDVNNALYPEDIVNWIKATQEDKWGKLVAMHGDEAQAVVVKRIAEGLANKHLGTLNMIRKGFSVAGTGLICMSQCAPEDNNNEGVISRYKANILRVVRQVKYNVAREWSIDLVLFLNGIPVSTIELKTDFTQSVDDAVAQYKKDRLPTYKLGGRIVPEPLLSFGRGAVVHFAMSDSLIEMTTQLKGDSTYFLPFNKGNDGHEGNPPREDGEYPVAYFWEEVCQRDNWLKIFHNFLYVEKKDRIDSHGKPYKSETLIFPRYHQLEAVNNMIADVKKNGPGKNYLNEHSAGSGKTSTIVWTSYDLIRLRHNDGKPYFNSIIIVTDRTVLDAQLQDAVKQLDPQSGVIATVDSQGFGDSKSKRLAKALKEGVPIIVVTIQTFPFAMKLIHEDKSLDEKSFAVIIDEAHTSQTGSTAHGLRASLAGDDSEYSDTVEDMLTKMQKSRVMPKNISHFAFTATPKHSTFELFGTLPYPDRPKNNDDNIPHAFHRYTQRQAIEEGFIKDVLENYTPYKEAYRLSLKDGAADQRVDKKLAGRALARWKSLHPTNVTQKVEFIVEHFRRNLENMMGGEAKAMVVTSGRAQAVKYKLAFDNYIKKHDLHNISALVAFSGKVPGSDLGIDDPESPLGFDVETDYSEYNLNPDARGRELRSAFEEDQFNVMIVANKFQTGFNQPKLVAMYLDKRISGVEAVQTLSRLNRTYPGKDKTYVIDFVNEPEEILNAFKSYDEGAQINSIQKPDVIYDIKMGLDALDIYNDSDVESFKQARGKAMHSREVTDDIHKLLFAATQRSTDVYNKRFKSLVVNLKNSDDAYDKAHSKGDKKGMELIDIQRKSDSKSLEELKDFKKKIARFVRLYSYIAQLIDLNDPDLENFSAFAKLLSQRLAKDGHDDIDLSGIMLTHYKLEKLGGDPEGKADELAPTTAGDKDATDREKEFISQIMSRLNSLFGDTNEEGGARKFLDVLFEAVMSDESVLDQISNNTKDQALKGDINNVLKAKAFLLQDDFRKMFEVIFSNSSALEELSSIIYDKFKQERKK